MAAQEVAEAVVTRRLRVVCLFVACAACNAVPPFNQTAPAPGGGRLCPACRGGRDEQDRRDGLADVHALALARARARYATPIGRAPRAPDAGD